MDGFYKYHAIIWDSWMGVKRDCPAVTLGGGLGLTFRERLFEKMSPPEIRMQTPTAPHGVHPWCGSITGGRGGQGVPAACWVLAG